jgi:hypothetical protein
MWNLPDWAKQTIAGTLITGVVFVIGWLVKRHHTSVNEKVLDFLNLDAPGADKSVQQISTGTNLNMKVVEASLRRLHDKHQVDVDQTGRWRKVRHYVVR